MTSGQSKVLPSFAFGENHGPKIFRRGESRAANSTNQRKVRRSAEQNCGICAQLKMRTATTTLLTWIGALGCMVARVTIGSSAQNDAEQRVDTRCGKGDR